MEKTGPPNPPPVKDFEEHTNQPQLPQQKVALTIQR